MINAGYNIVSAKRRFQKLKHTEESHCMEAASKMHKRPDNRISRKARGIIR